MTEKPQNIKVVMVGESGVGKTCIISQFINKTFQKDFIMSTMASFSSKIINHQDKSICLDIWDTAGQEKFKALTKFFYKDAIIVILVYDITRIESFEQLKTYWLDQVRNFAEKDIILGIAGNKADLIEKEQVNEEEARNFAKEIGAWFYRTSACKNIGIEELFTNLGMRYLDPSFVEIQEKKERRMSLKLNEVKKKENSSCCSKN